MTTKPTLVAKIGSLLGALFLVASVACAPQTSRVPSHGDTAGMDDSAQLQTGVPHFSVSDNTHPSADRWIAHVDLNKCLGEVAVCLPENAYETVSGDHNLLMTAGATALWNGLSTAGLATPFNTTNAQIAVGDGSTAPAVGNTDMAAAVGTKLNAADCTGATNATPIVLTCTFSPTPVTGQVVVVSGFTGAGAASVNITAEITAASGSTLTLLNSAGGGAITLAGGVVKPINYYRQRANAAGSAVVTTNQIVYVATYGTTNANFAWNEWGLTTGAQITNMEAQPPATLFDRATPGGGLGTKTSAASWTLTVTLSES